MLFALYNEDGSIHQANKVYDPTGYDDLLNERDYKFVSVNTSGPLSPDHWMVSTAIKELCERPTMKIEVNKTRIKCGDKDSALFTNCPKQASFCITTSGIPIQSGVLDATELEIYIPLPCVYRVTFDMWPFKQFAVDIEAVQ
jgi:hypothetical protein